MPRHPATPIRRGPGVLVGDGQVALVTAACRRRPVYTMHEFLFDPKATSAPSYATLLRAGWRNVGRAT